MNRKIDIWIIAAAVMAVAVFALTTPASALKKNIDGQGLTQLQGAGAWVIDVRANSEYVTGHLPNSLNLPLDQLQQVAPKWDKNQPIVVYCATGARSTEAASYLASQGFTQVYNLDKGIAAWTGQVVGGQPVTPVPTGAGVVKTAGRPVFIDFASST